MRDVIEVSHIEEGPSEIRLVGGGVLGNEIAPDFSRFLKGVLGLAEQV